MQKYNFYELKGKQLPDDVNEPVHKMLNNSLKCPEASQYLKKMEKVLNCGELQIFCKDAPKFIKIKVNYGMVEGYDLCEDEDTERFSITALKHIKNNFLSMKKPERMKKNG